MFILKFILFSLISTIPECFSDCRASFYTFCDNLSDLLTLKREDARDITELVIGRADSYNELYPFEKTNFLFGKFVNIKTLVIVHQIKDMRDLAPVTKQLWFPKFRNLFLYDNLLRWILAGFFNNVTLDKLSMVKNNIGHINQKPFLNCKIKSIDISENDLESIERGVFEEEYLGNFTKELYLKHNILKNVEENALPPSLEILSLDYNELDSRYTTLNFDNLVNLVELYVSHNKLSNVPSLQNSMSIEILDLSFNKFKKLDKKSFNNFRKLQILDLSNNQISTIDGSNEFLAGSEALPPVQVSLTFNRLTLFNASVLNNFNGNHILLLFGNPWICQCWHEVETFLEQKSFARNSCDLRFFNGGVAPYCLAYETNKTSCGELPLLPYSDYDLIFKENDFKRFKDATERARNRLNCSLVPGRQIEYRDNVFLAL